MEVVENNFHAFELLLGLVNIKVSGIPQIYCFDGGNNHEKKLKPTKEHLSKLIDYLAVKNFNDVQVNNPKRQKMFLGNNNDRNIARQEAQSELEANYDALCDSSKAWYIFEGFTSPDIFIEGEDYIIICEGKWTESHITVETTNLISGDHEYRNQMVRHIQGALNYSGKKVYAFYIVDKECGYLGELTKEAFEEQLSKETIKLSDTEKEKILSAFYGYTTWQDIYDVIPQINFRSKNQIQ